MKIYHDIAMPCYLEWIVPLGRWEEGAMALLKLQCPQLGVQKAVEQATKIHASAIINAEPSRC